jgi:hypothetical protein
MTFGRTPEETIRSLAKDAIDAALMDVAIDRSAVELAFVRRQHFPESMGRFAMGALAGFLFQFQFRRQRCGAAIVGMFSKQATDKLQELFTTLLRTRQACDAERADSLKDESPKPDA